VLHEDGGFTAQARAVLEEGAPLQLRGGSAPDHPTST
jgi:hypothetical protein